MSSSPAPAVQLKAVSKRYPMRVTRGKLSSFKGALLHGELFRVEREREGFLALDGIDLEVASGETVAVIGPNGSGKSTLLKIVSGILKPTTGTLTTTGRVTALIELGAGFHPEISGRDNAIVNGMMLGLSRAEIGARLPWIVEFSGIGEFFDQPVKTYSSGMYVRLGFAVAVAVEPEVLVVDEVLAVGDAAFTHKCLDRIARMQRKGTAILLVSHDLGLVEQLANRALYLRDGKPVFTGPAGVTVARYRADVAAVETSGEAEQGSPQRWGNNAVTLDAVELLDSRGQPTRLIASGEAAALRLAYTAHQGQTDFVFGISIHREDGTPVFGTNTDLDGWRPERLEGKGEIRISFPRLELAPARYLVDAAIHAHGGLAYDYACEALMFTVGAPAPWPGSYAPAHVWTPQGPAMDPPGPSADLEPGENSGVGPAGKA